MTSKELQNQVTDGEALRYHAPLRQGGQVGLTDERLLVDDDDLIAFPLPQISEVSIESFDWFLGVLSIVLVAFGIVSVPSNLYGGLSFALVGIGSLYWTYRNRGEVLVRLGDRPKPIRFHPKNTERFQEALSAALDTYGSNERTE